MCKPISGQDRLIFDLKVYKNELYAAGWFTAVGGDIANYIAKWNGSMWSSVGGGMDFYPNCLDVYKDEYVAGEFTKARGKPARNIAKWNGTTWSTLGKGQDVTKWIGEYKGILFTEGYAFETKNNFFQWNGSD
jgi:hypothetical protein